VIELKGISKAFEEGAANHRVLDSVDFTFESGKIYIMYGRSGSGKSTLFESHKRNRCSIRRLKIIDGKNLTSLNEKERTHFRKK